MINNPTDSTWRASVAGSFGNLLFDHLNSLENTFTFIDIGANQGVFSLVAAKNPNCRAVIAFEPNPSIFSILTRNVTLSPYTRKIKLFCAALINDDASPLVLNAPVGHSGEASFARDFNDGRSTESFSAIAVGDDFVKRVCEDLVEGEIHGKIDVEGAEATVLACLQSAGLLAKFTSITIEMSEHGGEENTRNILSMLSEAGFSLVRKEGSDRHYDAIFAK